MNAEDALPIIEEVKYPWLKIWYQPKKIFANLLEEKQGKAAYILSGLMGIVTTFYNALSREIPGDFPIAILIAMTIIIGFFAGHITMYIFGWFTGIVSKWFGGNASGEKLRIIFAWSSIPEIFSFIPYIPLILFFSSTLFMPNETSVLTTFDWVLLGLGLITFPFRVYRYILLIIGINEANQFPFWKGLLTVIIAVILPKIPAFLIFGTMLLFG